MHCGLRDDVPDFRLCARSITLDPLVRAPLLAHELASRAPHVRRHPLLQPQEAASRGFARYAGAAHAVRFVARDAPSVARAKDGSKLSVRYPGARAGRRSAGTRPLGRLDRRHRPGRAALRAFADGGRGAPNDSLGRPPSLTYVRLWGDHLTPPAIWIGSPVPGNDRFDGGRPNGRDSTTLEAVGPLLRLDSAQNSLYFSLSIRESRWRRVRLVAGPSTTRRGGLGEDTGGKIGGSRRRRLGRRGGAD